MEAKASSNEAQDPSFPQISAIKLDSPLFRGPEHTQMPYEALTLATEDSRFFPSIANASQSLPRPALAHIPPPREENEVSDRDIV